MIDKVRELHQPDADTFGRGLVCLGCDVDGYEADLPYWPCRTAELVYDQEEIADVLRMYAVWTRWMQAVRYRKRMAAPRKAPSLAYQVWEQQLLRQLEPMPLFSRVARD